MKNFKTLVVAGKTHVVIDLNRNDDYYPNPNYMGTGMALCGILNDGETLEEFKIRKEKTHLKNWAIVKKMPNSAFSPIK